MSIFKRLGKIIRSELGGRLETKRARPYEKTYYDEKTNIEVDDRSFNKEEREYYANLELSDGATFDDIKKSYRRLLKKYHPDHFNGSKKEKIAEEITTKINQAYEYFENKYKGDKK